MPVSSGLTKTGCQVAVPNTEGSGWVGKRKGMLCKKILDAIDNNDDEEREISVIIVDIFVCVVNS